MKNLRMPLGSLCLLSVLALAACGEGYVAEVYEGGVPYTDERTAWRGYSYVLAKLAPPAGPNLEPQQETDELLGPEWVPALEGTEVPEPAPVIEPADDLFTLETQK